MMNAIGRERGWPALSREQFDGQRTLRGALFVGSPDEVVEKILFQHELFGHQRFLLQQSVGTMPHANILRGIELLGTVVAPKVRKAAVRA
jgi:alkanesulfonate monooxygenase SsuD/methylene tetrahydromethanopterin reductase-like flavin-dependent oxidoreductase (luciferase family)